MIVRELTEADHEQDWALSLLAFGAPLITPVGPYEPGLAVGAFDGDRLLAKAEHRPYEQWWYGRPVAMAGVAGVAAHPDARGRGVVRQVLDALVRATSEPISALFPTAPGIYRRLGWEVVGSLDLTPVPLSALPREGVPVRPATEADLPAIADLYEAAGRAGSGLLTRSGPSFPQGTAGVLSHDVVSVVEQDGEVTGFIAYSRGSGYDGTSELKVWDCIAATAGARQSLLVSLRSWDAVAGTALFRGHTDRLDLGARVAAPRSVQPWSLRVLDPVRAIAARGFGLDGSAELALPGGTYRLEVSEGIGELSPVAQAGQPSVTAQGLALLYAGVGRDLQRRGYANAPVPLLEALFAGPSPEILDYF